METQVIEEGEIKLEVPKLENFRTSSKEYVPSKTQVFFNPVMEISRDLSVSSLNVLGEDIESLRICDSLAGVGARGLRYSAELGNISKVVVNDWNPKATKLIRKNVKLNELSRVEVRNEEANTMLYNHRPRFHVIDVDPFGTPVPFLDSSFSAISRRGILLVTATDTGPLCGAYQKACLRKYGAWPLRTSYSREIGLRILIGSVQRRAAGYDLALTPVLSHATQHFFRIHFEVDQGAKKADEIIKRQGYISHCYDCGKRTLRKGWLPSLPETCECGRDFDHAGPLWLENFAEKKHLEKVLEDLHSRDFGSIERGTKILNSCLDEADGPPLFYDLHKVSSRAKSSPPKLKYVLKKLKKSGYFASKTHFSNTGIRTDASIEVLTGIVAGDD
ncbi:hypothetical protein AKJ51_01135 [candidate division MSBL1 archaeon SCGC-AAA382A20]|uniref:tRNA (guanine(26)-N(2))-dimethyltransferase n=1 Tax=candidate division MSBL1 archaeon SCGC-AAA382A20 TaxID=1698280 RepID=A0A133VM29_9EURY|nr:hypothetical protein AKJ51_01135 [candidate division MSBL1 archaeon SCGC-AAA382A20]